MAVTGNGVGYLEANAWEMFIAPALVVQTVFYLVFPHLFRDLPIARAFSQPLDNVLTMMSLVAGVLMVIGMVWRAPKVRIAGLVLLVGSFLIRELAVIVVNGWAFGLYTLPTTMLVIGPSTVRVFRILVSGDYPPAMLSELPTSVPNIPHIEPRPRER